MNGVLVDIEKLRSFVDMLQFPTTAGELVFAAKVNKTDKNVITFLKTLDPLTKFADQEDLLTRAEEASLLREQAQEVSPDEPEEHEID